MACILVTYWIGIRKEESLVGLDSVIYYYLIYKREKHIRAKCN